MFKIGDKVLVKGYNGTGEIVDKLTNPSETMYAIDWSNKIGIGLYFEDEIIRMVD